MAYTIRNLVEDAFRTSGVRGTGMELRSDQLEDGIRDLNLILDSVHTMGATFPTVSVAVNWTGATSYTIGLAPVGITDPVPDIEVQAVPLKLEGVNINQQGATIIVPSVDPATFFQADSDLATIYPAGFYYQRTRPFATLRFMEGAPTGPGSIFFRPSVAEVEPNTDFSILPRELKPYLVYELASRIAMAEKLDPVVLKMQANNSWNQYLASAYEGGRYHADCSAPGLGENYRYNILADR